jgi:hypothetical protein
MDINVLMMSMLLEYDVQHPIVVTLISCNRKYDCAIQLASDGFMEP